MSILNEAEEIRCKKCNRLLFKILDQPINGEEPYIIEIVCPKCKYKQVIEQ